MDSYLNLNKGRNDGRVQRAPTSFWLIVLAFSTTPSPSSPEEGN